MRNSLLVILLSLGLSSPLISQVNDTTNNKDTTNTKFLELSINSNIGAALVRNTLSPVASGDLIFSFNNQYAIDVGYSGYFFFDKNMDGKNIMFVNSFINLELLFKDRFVNRVLFSDENIWGGIGGSYILNEQGDYFKNNAFKIYYIEKFRHVKIMPELIFDNGYVFPGLTAVF